MIKKLLIISLLALISCKKVADPPQINTFYKEVITPEDRKTITTEEAKTYHIDNETKYEYRTGSSGHYEYNYDVKGINAKGDSVYGNINVLGKYGAGIIKNSDKETVDIKTEWIGYGKLKAKDIANDEYDLIVD